MTRQSIFFMIEKIQANEKICYCDLILEISYLWDISYLFWRIYIYTERIFCIYSREYLMYIFKSFLKKKISQFTILLVIYSHLMIVKSLFLGLLAYVGTLIEPR